MKLEDAIKTSKFKSVQHKAGLNILYTAWWMRTQSLKVLKPFDLTPEQYNVLRILKGKHPNQMCVKDIGSRMIEKNSNVPRIIDKLVRKKMVSRVQSSIDRRETVISLTEQGVDVLLKANQKIDGLMSELISISSQQAEQLSDMLELVRRSE